MIFRRRAHQTSFAAALRVADAEFPVAQDMRRMPRGERVKENFARRRLGLIDSLSSERL
jgi:hypothetical protein